MKSLSGVLVKGALSVSWLGMEKLSSVTPCYFPNPYIIRQTGSIKLQEKYASDDLCHSYCDLVVWNVTVTVKQRLSGPLRAMQQVLIHLCAFSALRMCLYLECNHSPFREAKFAICKSEKRTNLIISENKRIRKMMDKLNLGLNYTVHRNVWEHVIYWWEKW